MNKNDRKIFNCHVNSIQNIIGTPPPKSINQIIPKKNRLPWVDKYRPKVLREVIGHDDVKNVLKSSIENGNLPHLLFHGGAGTGKTSTVMALAMQLYGPVRVGQKVLELNASDENGINVVRDKIISFAKIVVGTSDPNYPSPAFKMIILDEADSMTGEAQTALKKVMEATCDITRFVFICNYENKIIEAIKSRCASFRFNPIPHDIMIERMRYIAMNESIDISDEVLTKITEICDGDARQNIMTMQNLKYCIKNKSKSNKITLKDVYNMTSYINDDFLDPVWNTILNSNTQKIANIAMAIINTGYPANTILNCIQSKIIKNNHLNDQQKSSINLYIANVERMLSHGTEYQLLAVLIYINAIYRNLDIIVPTIY